MTLYMEKRKKLYWEIVGWHSVFLRKFKSNCFVRIFPEKQNAKRREFKRVTHKRTNGKWRFSI